LVQVFDLLEHKHVTVTVEQLEPYVYDEKVGDKLVLPSDDRKLIETLVRSVDMQGEDIIRGKSGGVMILLSGAPGSGKTLTAEVTAEIAKRPLYTVQCAQLTFNPSEIEKELLEVLKNALRWKAILLIDEADIFVHARGDDMEQNAVVGVFLRLLEYYKGILFMNTNRGADIDDAIRSRAIAHVEYELLSWNKDKERESVEKLWAVLTSQYGVEFADETERTYTLTEFPKLSGRTIKQLIRLCKTAHPGEKLTAGMIKWAAKYQRLAIKGTDE
jgi:AAA+ superfamily predicted ATPase